MCRALNGITFTNCYHITFETGRHIGCNRAYFVTHPRRSITRTLANALQSLFILLKEKPELIISTGADVAIPTLVLGRLLGAQTIFVETCGSLKPSLAGRIAYHFSSLFIVQWPDKLNHFPRASLADGPLL